MGGLFHTITNRGYLHPVFSEGEYPVQSWIGFILSRTGWEYPPHPEETWNQWIYYEIETIEIHKYPPERTRDQWNYFVGSGVNPAPFPRKNMGPVEVKVLWDGDGVPLPEHTDICENIISRRTTYADGKTKSHTYKRKCKISTHQKQFLKSVRSLTLCSPICRTVLHH